MNETNVDETNATTENSEDLTITNTNGQSEDLIAANTNGQNYKQGMGGKMPTSSKNPETNEGRPEASGEMPEMNEEMPEMNGKMPEPPEMNCDENGENCEIPTPPDGEMMGGFRGGKFEQTDASAVVSSDPMSPLLYMSVGAGSLLVSVVIIYAFLSGFFRKAPGQTFDSAKKFWLAVGATIILTALIVGVIFAIVH